MVKVHVARGTTQTWPTYNNQGIDTRAPEPWQGLMQLTTLAVEDDQWTERVPKSLPQLTCPLHFI